MATDIMDPEDKARLELTLGVRERIIRKMTEGNKLPEGPEDRDFLMKALDGTDRTVLTKTKIKSDDAASKDQANTAKVVASVLLQMRNRSGTTSLQELTLGDVPDIQLVNEETYIGVKPFKTEQFGSDS